MVFSYPASWLKSRNLSSSTVKSHRKNVYLSHGKLWNKKEIEQRLQKFDHSKVMNDDKALHDFLYAVCCDGIAVLKNGPIKDKETVTKIGDRIGLIHQTHFGKTFEVTTKVEASNMAYAHGGELPYHTDFPSLSQPPELQMLYMFQKAPNNGGLSMFVDGFYIAELMREKYSDAFKILSETPIEFIEEGYDIHERDGKNFKFIFDMASKHRTIK
uniref:TauD/TfdA-like domain-containing protein n=1 Tax=Panagrolaimus davidi TaxID=227884 RepID=A0A914QA59_9BILA